MPRRILEGEVVSDKMDKTVTVLVERRTMHPVYKKFVRQTSKYAAHDENNAFKTGDRVQIEECRPISKRKKWTVITKPGPNAGRPKRETVSDDGAAVKNEKKAAAAAKKAEKKADSAKKSETKSAAAKKPAAKKATSKKKDEE